MTNIIYCIYNLETNGCSVYYDDIIEMYALLIDKKINQITDPFYSKCRPVKSIGYTEQIHGISDEILKNEKLFDVVSQQPMS